MFLRLQKQRRRRWDTISDQSHAWWARGIKKRAKERKKNVVVPFTVLTWISQALSDKGWGPLFGNASLTPRPFLNLRNLNDYNKRELFTFSIPNPMPRAKISPNSSRIKFPDHHENEWRVGSKNIGVCVEQLIQGVRKRNGCVCTYVLRKCAACGCKYSFPTPLLPSVLQGFAAFSTSSMRRIWLFSRRGEQNILFTSVSRQTVENRTIN